MAQKIPLMQKATAVWLVDNTALTFEQIADFCGMHPLEVQGIADGEVAIGIIGQDPIADGQITQEDLTACEADDSKRLTLLPPKYADSNSKKKGTRYTPVARRRDKPDAIQWLVKHYPHMSDAQIGKLVGTTKNTIKAIRERSHWNMSNIKPRDPVLLGLCSQRDLDKAIAKAELAKPKAPEGEATPENPAEAPANAPADTADAKEA